MSYSGSASISKGRAGVVQAAQEALAHRGDYQYDEIRPMPASLFGAPPVRVDCSSFYTLCNKAAGLPDPNGLGYNGDGNTTTLQAHGKQTRAPEGGDAAFYDNPAHVTVCIGDGECISMGQPGDPQKLPVDYRTVTQYRTYSNTPSSNGTSGTSGTSGTVKLAAGGPGALKLLLFATLTVGAIWTIHKGVETEIGAAD